MYLLHGMSIHTATGEASCVISISQHTYISVKAMHTDFTFHKLYFVSDVLKNLPTAMH